MKKLILSCIIGFMILIMSNQSLAVTATVNATAVRVRETASTSANIVTNIYKEDEVEILEENGDWYKVKYGEKVGFAKAEFFTKKNQEPENVTQQNTAPVENTTAEPATNTPNQDNTVQELKVGENITLSNAIKIRLIPNLSTNSKTEIAKGTNVMIEAQLGNWYKIVDQTSSGWVTASKLTAGPSSVEQPNDVQPEPAQTEPEVAPENTAPTENVIPEQPAEQPQETPIHKTAVVIVETARVRDGASTNANIIDVLDEDDVVTIIGEEGKFYKISTDKINTGYISKTLVKEKDVTSRGTIEERANNEKQEAEPTPQTTSSASQNDVVAFAKQYLGYPYVLGCSSPEAGFDCSGFTRYVFAHFGYTLGRVAADQTSVGAVVERANLQAGDLILFYDNGNTKIGHCGIYIGGGNFIHSANPKRGVVTDNLNTNSYYSQRFVTARRIIQ